MTLLNYLKSSPNSVYEEIVQDKCSVFDSNSALHSTQERSLVSAALTELVNWLSSCNKTDMAVMQTIQIFYPFIYKYDLSHNTYRFSPIQICSTSASNNLSPRKQHSSAIEDGCRVNQATGQRFYLLLLRRLRKGDPDSLLRRAERRGDADLVKIKNNLRRSVYPPEIKKKFPIHYELKLFIKYFIMVNFICQGGDNDGGISIFAVQKSTKSSAFKIIYGKLSTFLRIILSNYQFLVVINI